MNRVSTIEEIKKIIFRLLGNTLSSVLLPDYVIILEGPSDTTFLNKVLELLGKNTIRIQNSRGNITYAIQAITQFLRFNQHINPV